MNDHFEDRLPYRLTDEGTAIGVYEIQERFHTGDKYLFPICQFRLTLAGIVNFPHFLQAAGGHSNSSHL